MDIKYKVSPKKIERIRERQTALLDELEDLMMQRFASEPERYGADYDSRDELAVTRNRVAASVAI